MPRYHFDIFIGDSDQVDSIGRELDDDASARSIALHTLGIAREEIPRGDEGLVTLIIRRGGTPIYNASFGFKERWIQLNS